MAGTAPLLEVVSVSAGYGPIEVLHGVSLSVHRGEVVTIIGANGAGKTTLLMTISGIHRVERGSIRFDEKEISALPPHQLVARGLAQVPEGRKIFPRLTVSENLRMGAFLRSDREEISADFEKMFDLFPILKERRSQLAGTLSGGEQQMLAIARALMSRPVLLLMDEPSMGVAPLLVKKIFETLERLAAEGLTILLVEQNAHLALSLARRGYVLENGAVVLEDNAKVLLEDDRVRDAYLGGKSC